MHSVHFRSDHKQTGRYLHDFLNDFPNDFPVVGHDSNLRPASVLADPDLSPEMETLLKQFYNIPYLQNLLNTVLPHIEYQKVVASKSKPLRINSCFLMQVNEYCIVPVIGWMRCYDAETYDNRPSDHSPQEALLLPVHLLPKPRLSIIKLRL